MRGDVVLVRTPIIDGRGQQAVGRFVGTVLSSPMVPSAPRWEVAIHDAADFARLAPADARVVSGVVVGDAVISVQLVRRGPRLDSASVVLSAGGS